ncbi:Yip1 domain protein [uncultured archaeon]|nr:Yip1 domain protein [uncultured archaeon]
MQLIEKVKGFLGDPSKEFNLNRDEAPEEAVKYYLIIAGIYSLLSAIVFALIYTMVSPLVNNYGLLTQPYGITEIFSNFFMSFILMLIGVFIWGTILYIFAFALGGRKGFIKTIRAAMYATTPLALIGWIPLLGAIGWIWVCALDIIGLHVYQDISPGRAIAAVIISSLLLFVTVLVVLIVIITTIVPMVLEGISV